MEIKIKSFNVRLPKELWTFLRHRSIEVEKSMNEIIVECIQKLKNKEDKRLQNHDTAV